MNILITGANGFIGKHLTKEMLENGYDVYAIVSNINDMCDLNNERLHCFELLFDNYSSISHLVNVQIDIAYHLAWCGLSGKNARDINIQLLNVDATNQLLFELKKLNTRKIVFASTMNVLELYNILVNPACHKMRGTHIHVAIKDLVEVMIRVFCEENNIEFNEGIVAMVYGEGNKSNMITNVFISTITNGYSPDLIDGNSPYDLIYVKDVAKAFHLIGTRGKTRKSYYIGHSWEKTFKEIFTEIRNILNPSVALKFGTFIDESCIDFSFVDKKALNDDTGWEPHYDFKESIISTADWIAKQGLKF